MNNNEIEGFLNNSYENAHFPFKTFITDKGKILKIVAITAPFRSDEHRQKYEEYKMDGYCFVGVTSYLEFPGKIINPHDDNYHKIKKDNCT